MDAENGFYCAYKSVQGYVPKDQDVKTFEAEVAANLLEMGMKQGNFFVSEPRT